MKKTMAYRASFDVRMNARRTLPTAAPVLDRRNRVPQGRLPAALTDSTRLRRLTGNRLRRPEVGRALLSLVVDGDKGNARDPPGETSRGHQNAGTAQPKVLGRAIVRIGNPPVEGPENSHGGATHGLRIERSNTIAADRDTTGGRVANDQMRRPAWRLPYALDC